MQVAGEFFLCVGMLALVTLSVFVAPAAVAQVVERRRGV